MKKSELIEVLLKDESFKDEIKTLIQHELIEYKKLIKREILESLKSSVNTVNIAKPLINKVLIEKKSNSIVKRKPFQGIVPQSAITKKKTYTGMSEIDDIMNEIVSQPLEEEYEQVIQQPSRLRQQEPQGQIKITETVQQFDPKDDPTKYDWSAVIDQFETIDKQKEEEVRANQLSKVKR